MKRLYTKEIAIGILIAIILLMGWYGKRHLHTDKPNNIEVINYRQHIIDSINNEKDSISLFQIDSLKKVSTVKIEIYKRSAARNLSEANRLKHVSDSLMALNGAKLDTICTEIVKAKQNEIDTLYEAVNDLGDEAEGYSHKLYLTEQSLVIVTKQNEGKISQNLRLNEQINKLQKQVKRTWLERNAVWIGAICGSATTILIMK